MNIEIFEIDEHGYRDGKPYVLPHKPGEISYGLVHGWYWNDLDTDDEPEGPFNSERGAKADAEGDL